MQFRKWAGLVLLASVAACGGEEGQRLHGEVEHEGTVVTYETWYHPPGIGQRVFGGADGLSNRISVAGKTVSMTGNYIPPEWKNAPQAEVDDYSPKFWAGVAEKFNAIKPPKDHEDEHKWIYNELIALRDAPLGPGNKYYGEHALMASPEDPNIVSHAGPNDDLTGEEEAKASKIAGEEYAELLKKKTSG